MPVIRLKMPPIYLYYDNSIRCQGIDASKDLEYDSLWNHRTTTQKEKKVLI